MYRRRETCSRKLQNMINARERKRLEGPAPDYPGILPDLRREVIIKNHDFGTVEHHIKLFKSDRIDCYRMEVDGRPYIPRIGWSRILEVIRKNFIRVGSV